MNYKHIAIGVLLLCWLIIAIGCDTPRGGSSIPWNKPASWEGKTFLSGIQH
jgi:hypothetical protein